MKKAKLSTPQWILDGYDSEEEYNKKKGIGSKKKAGKVFKISECPECHSDKVSVVLVGEEGKCKGEWECHSCKWTGTGVIKKELDEDEFMKYLDDKGEEVA